MALLELEMEPPGCGKVICGASHLFYRLEVGSGFKTVVLEGKTHSNRYAPAIKRDDIGDGSEILHYLGCKQPCR